jgi:branched-chain amino acid transport system substrate-binding protein
MRGSASIRRLLLTGSLATGLAVLTAGSIQAKPFAPTSTKAHAADDILIGNISTINSPVIQATDLVNGTKAWIDYINSKGGVQGRKIKLVVCDDQGSAALSIQCAQNLLDQGVVALAGQWSIVFGANALSTIEKGNTAILGGWPITDQEYASPIEFPVTAGAAGAYPALAVMLRSLGVKDLAGMWLNTPAAVTSSDLVTQVWNGLNGAGKYTPVYFAATAADYTPVAATAVGSGAQGLFLATPASTAVRLLQALQNTGFKGEFGMTGLAAVPSVLTSAGATLNGAYMTYPGVPPMGKRTAQLKLFHAVMAKNKVPADALSEAGAAGGQYLWDVLKSIKGPITRDSVLAAAKKKTTWPGFLTHSMSSKFAPPQYPAIRNPYNVVVKYLGKGAFVKQRVKGYPQYSSLENGTFYISGFAK